MGFTLIELLVVIAIIGILVALLLPAIQAAREAARRMQCTNNIKQIVTAMHSYHDTHGCLPYNNKAYSPRNGPGNSWMAAILPYLEQQALYDRIDFFHSTAPVNFEIEKTVVPTFLCPSDSNEGGLMPTLCNLEFHNAGYVVAVTNYKACMGSNWGERSPDCFTTRIPMPCDAVCVYSEPSGRWANDQAGEGHGNGIICINECNLPENVTRAADIRDGTSNTFATGETVAAWNCRNYWFDYRCVGATCGIPLNYVSIAVSAGSAPRWFPYANASGFHSRHPGGANIGLCDGHVAFISDDIDITTYRRLASIDDGHPAQVP